MKVSKNLVDVLRHLDTRQYEALINDISRHEGPLLKDRLALVRHAREGGQPPELSVRFAKRAAQYRMELYEEVCGKLVDRVLAPRTQRHSLDVAIMLLNLGLQMQSLDWLQDAKRTATMVCDHTLHLECLDTERKVLKDMTGTFRQQQDNRSEIRAALRTLNAVAELRLMADEMLTISRTSSPFDPVRQRADDIVTHRLVSIPDEATSFKARSYRYIILCLYHKWTEDVPKAYEDAESHMNLWDLHPEMVAHEPMVFVNAVGNLMNYSLLLGHTDRFESLRQRLNQRKYHSRAFEVELFRTSEMALMLHRLQCQQFDELINDRARLIQNMERLNAHLPISFVAATHWNMAIACMICGQGRMSIQHFARLDHKRIAEARPHLHLTALAFKCLMHLDRDLFTHDDLRRLRRACSTSSQVPDTVSLILSHLPVLDEHKGRKTYSDINLKLIKECERLARKSQKSNGIEEYALWLLGHATGRSLRELFSEEAHKQVLGG
jgi:hypothetical protein